jgi:serine protease Do/serine protease DegQ
VEDLTLEIAKALRLDVTEEAVIAQVEPGSAGDRAGLKRVGQPVDLTVDRDGSRRTLTVVIQEERRADRR